MGNTFRTGKLMNGLYVDDNGRVGIGLTNPSYKLSILVDGGGSEDGIRLGVGSNGDGIKIVQRYLSDRVVAQLGQSNYSGASDSGSLRLYDVSGTETIRLSGKSGVASYITSGNVGIGSAPQERLTITGPSGVAGMIRWTDGVTASAFIGMTSGGLPYIHSNNTSLAFGANGSNNFAETMRISNGNLGIGTTSPGAKLEVVGTIKMSATAHNGYFGSASFSWAGGTDYPTLFGGHPDRWVMHINPHISYSQNGANGYTGNTFGAMIRMASNAAADNFWDMGVLSSLGGDKWGIGRNGTNLASLTTGGTWATNGGGTSDLRTKKNIEYIKFGGIDLINKLNPVKFEFILCPEKTRRGFIAQDVLEVIPDLVLGDGEREGGTYGLDYDGILALNVKATQEIVEKYDSEIAKLKAEIEILKNK